MNTEIDEFVLSYMNLIKCHAYKISRQIQFNLMPEDLIGYGVIGLYDAIEKFDPDKNIKFKTYAEHRVKGEMLDAIRNLDHLPRSLRELVKNGLKEDVSHVPWEEIVGRERLEGVDNSLDDEIYIQQLNTILMQTINKLPDRQKECILESYFYNDSQVNASIQLGLASSTISTYVNRGLKTLKKILTSQNGKGGSMKSIEEKVKKIQAVEGNNGNGGNNGNKNENITNVEKLSNELGFKIIEKYISVPIDQIKIVQAPYQRGVQIKRKKEISKLIQQSNGYWPGSIIYLNEKYEIIDGQHRVAAARENNITMVPSCILQFNSEEKEAKFYLMINEWSNEPKPIDLWNSRKEADHLLAKIIYQLKDDINSKLYQRIVVKGEETRAKKFSPSDVITMINTGVLNLMEPWRKSTEARIISKLKNFSYQEINLKLNKLLNFVYSAFGSEKSNNPIAYRVTSLRAILFFYAFLNSNNVFDTEKSSKAAIAKMQTYEFTSEFIKMTHNNKITALNNHFNIGKSENHRIYYRV